MRIRQHVSFSTAAQLHASIVRTLLFFLLCCLLPSAVQATVYVKNETYPSLPALFGRFMVEGKIYHARLQFLPENPYLCESFNPNTTSFKRPSLNINDLDIVEPAVLLASRGNCPFARKAAVAESMDHSVQFLLIHNYNLEGEDTLVPMYTEYGDTRLVLLSITHRAGQALRNYWQQQTDAVKKQGGPFIELDGQPPPGMLTQDDLQQMVMSALGLFFLLVSFSGCIMILLGMYGQLNGGRVVFNDYGQPVVVQRTRMTQQQVQQLPTTDAPADSSCAICLDEDPGGRWTVLPCQHVFHTDCIVPWLTERQAKCPLCKFDVLEHLQEEWDPTNTAGTATTSPLASLWTRLTRSRWTQVNHDTQDGVVIGADEMVVEELELTEQPDEPEQRQLQ